MVNNSMFPGSNTCFAVSLFILVSAVSISSCAAQQPPDQTARGIVARAVERAHATGKSAIEIPYPQVLMAEPEGLEAALAHSSVVIARLVKSDVGHSSNDIVTWRKYRIVERLSSQPVVPQGLLQPNDAPASLLPLDPDEFLVPELGGTLNVDGVMITEQDSRHPTALPGGDRHLMFLSFRFSGTLATLNYGPAGLFSVDDSDTIHPAIIVGQHRLRDELLEKTSGSLTKLRVIASAIKSQSQP